MTIGAECCQLAPGETVHVPPDVVHASANIGPVPGKRLVIFSPAGMENFFLEAGAQSPHAETDPAAALAAAIRHGWEFIADTR